MSVLLLRLCGPMQSWGVQSRFSIRDTGLEPSKSGVVGLLCAALGRPRVAPIDDLARLTMGVRVDQEGQLRYDYHTAMDVMRASGGNKPTEPSRRYYVADAKFLVGFAGEDNHLLQTLHEKLYNPVWELFLGRKSFVPSEPIWLEDGFKPRDTLCDALQRYPSLRLPSKQKAAPEKEQLVRLVMEDSNGVEARPDQPISFALGQRRFATRRVTTSLIELPTSASPNSDLPRKDV
jgi:CRISPR system Cascade subunit CasD